MKYKIASFFAGRNGVDELGKVTLWTCVILILLSYFLPEGLNSVVYILALALLIYSYFRILSKNLEKRWAENNAFVSKKSELKCRWQQRKTHKFYHCPNCKTTLRVPKGKGKISITCRSCGERFVKKT